MLVKNIVTGSSPCVLHRNGKPPAWATKWEALVADFFAETHEPCEPCPELTVLTWTNRPTKTLLERCLDKLGIPCLALGRRLPEWRNDMKLYLNVEALDRVQSEYVMGLDADDVLVLAEPQRLLAAFTAFECDIVFSTEKNSWPNVRFLNEFEDSLAESAYCYLNSGAWIGKTDACRRFFRACLAEDAGDILAAHPTKATFRDDQGVTRKTFRKHHPAVTLDYHCRIFQSLNRVAASGEVVVSP